MDILIEPACSSETRKLRRQFKYALKLVRNLRDFQTQEKILQQKLKPTELPELKSWLKTSRKTEQRKIRGPLNEVPVNRQGRKILAIGETLVRMSENAQLEKKMRGKLEQILLSRFEAFETCAQQARAAVPDTLHKARIAFKKYRYTWDSLEPFFPRSENMDINLKSIQNFLGDIQDGVVLNTLLFKFLVDQKNSCPDLNFRRFLRNCEEQQEECGRDFEARRKHLIRSVHPGAAFTRQKAA